MRKKNWQLYLGLVFLLLPPILYARIQFDIWFIRWVMSAP